MRALTPLLCMLTCALTSGLTRTAFAQAPPPLDPKVHTWSKEWDGLNHVLWEAGALTLLALLVQHCKC